MPYPYRSFREWIEDEEKLGNVGWTNVGSSVGITAIS